MARTTEVRITRSRGPVTSPRHIRLQAPPRLASAKGEDDVIFTVTCGACGRQYHALGDQDGVYEQERQPEPHDCAAR